MVCHYFRLRGTQIPRVPVRDLLVAAVRIQKQHFRMLLDEFRTRVSGQRRPPQLGLESLSVDLVHKRPQIPVAMRKLLWLQEPITLRGLPAGIQRDPGEAEFLHDGKSAVDLAGLDLPAVAPGTPDGAEGAIGRGVEP